MQKIAFTMRLKPGNEEEYRRRHDDIWPALSELLQKAGIFDYSIFLDSNTGILFAVHKQTDNHQLEQLPLHIVMKKWWAYMADIMETNPDNSPKTIPLKLVFHME